MLSRRIFQLALPVVALVAAVSLSGCSKEESAVQTSSAVQSSDLLERAISEFRLLLQRKGHGLRGPFMTKAGN